LDSFQVYLYKRYPFYSTMRRKVVFRNECSNPLVRIF